MENQHRQIHGYRELGRAEIALMNDIKALGPELQALVARINRYLIEQSEAGVRADGAAESDRLDQADPFHWSRVGQQQLQQGLMALTRAIAQPTFF